MTETTADILAIGQVIDKPADRQTVTNGLRADMLSSAGAPLLNSFTQTAFAANVGLVAVTVLCATAGVYIARDWGGAAWFASLRRGSRRISFCRVPTSSDWRFCPRGP